MEIKKLAIIAALAAATAVTGATYADAGNAKKGTQTTYISLDGICDIVQITVFPWHQAGEYDDSCGVDSPVVGSGMWGNVTGVTPKDLTIGETASGDPKGTYLWNIQYPLKTGNSYSIYLSYDGVNYYYYTSGTYSITDRAAMHSHRPGPSLRDMMRSR
jgi:hypothetical protein